jgi:hypothetical protein
MRNGSAIAPSCCAAKLSPRDRHPLIWVIPPWPPAPSTFPPVVGGAGLAFSVRLVLGRRARTRCAEIFSPKRYRPVQTTGNTTHAPAVTPPLVLRVYPIGRQPPMRDYAGRRPAAMSARVRVPISITVPRTEARTVFRPRDSVASRHAPCPAGHRLSGRTAYRRRLDNPLAWPDDRVLADERRGRNTP